MTIIRPDGTKIEVPDDALVEVKPDGSVVIGPKQDQWPWPSLPMQPSYPTVPDWTYPIVWC